MCESRQFKDRLVLVTGGGGGLGAALCRAFASQGARIAVCDIDTEGLKQVCQELRGQGVEAWGYECDVSDQEACFATVERVKKEAGDIHVLVNNAGIAHRSAFVKTHPRVFQHIIGVNLMGSIYFTKAAIEQLIASKGMVIGISSVAGFAPLTGRTAYAAAKHGLAGFLNTLRTEVEPLGVSVMLVYATYIQTNIDRNALDAEGNRNQNVKITSGNVLLPDEAAQEIVKAASRNERQLMLGDQAQASWDLYHQDPRMFEQIMFELNKYVLEQ